MSEILERRERTIEDLGDGVRDTVVVGGGINGAGVLLDAATRGMDAVLVERDDLAVGTSSRSSKLIHGGLRYLEHLQFGLVREALVERRLLTRLAPHLVAMRRFAVPVIGGRWQLPYIASGLLLYDLLGGADGGRFEVLSIRGLTDRIPNVDARSIVGGFEYSDGVCDDARMVVAVAETARRRGGRILTHTEVRDIDHEGGVWNVELVDRLTGSPRWIRARSVVDVTGAFEADQPEFESEGSVTTSRGIHLVLPGDRIAGARGMTIRVPGRVVFVIPWGLRWLVGTTDETHDGPVDRPAATPEEVDYLLDTVNTVMSSDLTRDDVLTTFAGIRPLAGPSRRGDTSEVSREHRIHHDGRGLVSVRGGKYTTYRLIAAEAVDVAAEATGVERRSVTDSLNLVGAASPSVLESIVASLRDRGLDPVEARWMVGRHGTEALEVVEAGREAGLSGRLHPDMPYRAEEAWWAVHREGALTIDDVVARRTRLAVETSDHGWAAVAQVTEVLADVHHWTGDDTARAIAAYEASSRAEYGVPDTATSRH